MKQSFLRQVLAVQSDAILDVFTSRQHTHPHAPLSAVLQTVTEELRCCPDAITRATEWLKLDSAQAIGRLRRTELMQLSKAIHRFWERNASRSKNSPTSR